MSTKICGICLESKLLSEFGRDGGAGYLRYECKSCARAQARLVRNLKKSVPPPSDDHRCPICLRNKDEIQGYSIKKKGWCADHDHATGKFRAWICHKCNLALGNFGDDPGRLERALAYIMRHQS